MLKPILAGAIILGSVSFAVAMPVASVQTGASLPVVKAAIIVKRVVRRPPVRRRVIIKKTIVR